MLRMKRLRVRIKYDICRIVVMMHTSQEGSSNQCVRRKIPRRRLASNGLTPQLRLLFHRSWNLSLPELLAIADLSNR